MRSYKESNLKYNEENVIDLLLRYDDDDEVISLIKELKEDYKIYLNLGVLMGKHIEFALWGWNCGPDFHSSYHIGEGKLRDLFIATADSVREWSKENQYEYESFIECFGVENRKSFVKLVDKHLSL